MVKMRGKKTFLGKYKSGISCSQASTFHILIKPIIDWQEVVLVSGVK